MTWTLHYADGSRFSSEDGPPEASPPFRVVFVTQPWVNSGDIVGDGALALLYRTDKGGWMPVFDEFGLMDQLAHYAHLISCVRPGHQMWTPDYKDKVQAALEEMRGG